MPFTVPAEELATLIRADELGRGGMKQIEIAAELGVDLQTLRSRAERRGFKLTPATRVIDLRTGETLPDLIERGDVTAEASVPTDPAHEPAVA